MLAWYYIQEAGLPVLCALSSSGGPGIGLAVRNIEAANPGRSGPFRRSAAGSNACNQVGIRPHPLVV